MDIYKYKTTSHADCWNFQFIEFENLKQITKEKLKRRFHTAGLVNTFHVY